MNSWLGWERNAKNGNNSSLSRPVARKASMHFCYGNLLFQKMKNPSRMTRNPLLELPTLTFRKLLSLNSEVRPLLSSKKASLSWTQAFWKPKRNSCNSLTNTFREPKLQRVPKSKPTMPRRCMQSLHITRERCGAYNGWRTLNADYKNLMIIVSTGIRIWLRLCSRGKIVARATVRY